MPDFNVGRLIISRRARAVLHAGVPLRKRLLDPEEDPLAVIRPGERPVLCDAQSLRKARRVAGTEARGPKRPSQATPDEHLVRGVLPTCHVAAAQHGEVVTILAPRHAPVALSGPVQHRQLSGARRVEVDPVAGAIRRLDRHGEERGAVLPGEAGHVAEAHLPSRRQLPDDEISRLHRRVRVARIAFPLGAVLEQRQVPAGAEGEAPDAGEGRRLSRLKSPQAGPVADRFLLFLQASPLGFRRPNAMRQPPGILGERRIPTLRGDERRGIRSGAQTVDPKLGRTVHPIDGHGDPLTTGRQQRVPEPLHLA